MELHKNYQISKSSNKLHVLLTRNPTDETEVTDVCCIAALLTQSWIENHTLNSEVSDHCKGPDRATLLPH